MTSRTTPSGGAVIARPTADDDPETLLSDAADAGASVFVLVSSARVYGASPSNDLMLDEAAAISDHLSDPNLRSLAEADRICSEAAADGGDMRIVVLRPVHVLGPDTDTALSRYLRAPRVRGAFGFDPLMQLIHEDDVSLAVKLAVDHDVSGPYNVSGPGGLPLSVLLGEAGASRITGPTGLIVDRLEGAGLRLTTRLNTAELRYVLSVDDARFRAATGFEPRHSLDDIVATIKDR